MSTPSLAGPAEVSALIETLAEAQRLAESSGPTTELEDLLVRARRQLDTLETSVRDASGRGSLALAHIVELRGRILALQAAMKRSR